MVTARPWHEAVKYEAVASATLVERASLIVKTQSGVRGVLMGYPTVTYYDNDGNLREHTFDFSSVSVYGHRVAVSVVENEEAEKALIPLIDLLNRRGLRGIGSEGTVARLADCARIWTEKDVSQKQLQVAHEILLSRMEAEQADVDYTKKLIETMRLPVRLSKLLEYAERPQMRRHSIWRLVDEGFLKVLPIDIGSIDHITIFRD